MTRTTGGSIRHHATRDLWEARYVGADGRRHSIYRRTERLAQEALRKALTDVDNGLPTIDQRRTTAVFLDDWLTASVRQRVRSRTAESYAHTVRLYIMPAIGRVPLAKLEPQHVGRLLAELTARQDLSASTVRYVYSVLRTALGYALRQGAVVRNVATLVDPPAKSRPEMQPLTRDQARAFLDGIRGDRLEALYLVALGTGLRQGEILALRWQDVDLARGELTVRHTLGRFSRQLEPTKTPRSRRTLRLPQQVTAALAAHRERQAVVPLSGLVFTSGAGPLQQVNVTRDFQLALRRLGLPRRRFHDLRHTFATLALEAGEGLDAVSRALGHTSVATTADIYGHWAPAMQERLADRMGAILSL
jgi:integrase